MKQLFLFFILLTLLPYTFQAKEIVHTSQELTAAIKEAQPGEEIIMANGIWKDIQIEFTCFGTKEKPIILKAETAGKVFIEGASCLKFGGTYLIVSGLYFKNGYTPTNAVIDFKTSKENVANHCRITNCVIENYNQLKRDRQDYWVEFWGKNNQMDHCYIAGKSNQGPTVRVEIKGNRNIRNFHKIVDNHFGPRPRKGGPKGETIQLGDSFSSMSPSNTLVANNLFEKCNGEVEIISSKTNFNIFKNNVFYLSEGSLVTRHGNYCEIDGNYFIGDGISENIGGIRLINTGHSVTNNYFYNLKGKNFRSPLAVMNGIPKSPLNRYNQVTDVTVAYNTWIDCSSPLQFGVGTNISQKEVLPLSEIRSARPVRMEVVNNIIYNTKRENSPIIIEHDKADGVTFSNNYINNQGLPINNIKGLEAAEFNLSKISENSYLPIGIANNEVYTGFGMGHITEDLFGNKRTKSNNVPGAIISTSTTDPIILDKKKYGADWFSNIKPKTTPVTFNVKNSKELIDKVSEASAGDILLLESGIYTLTQSVVINKKITIASKDSSNKSQIRYKGKTTTPAFEMNPKGALILKDIILKGTYSQYAFASLKDNMSSLYNLSVSGCKISDFNYVLKGYKQSFADEIRFRNTLFKNCENGIELSEETNDKGDYNVEFLTIDNCVFDHIQTNVIDYYRGGYDESTIGGSLVVTNSSFTNSGAKETNGVLLNHRGIVNVTISKNTFKNNKVKLVALLWGAKNNRHSNNIISKSGKLLVEENLKLKIVY